MSLQRSRYDVNREVRIVLVRHAVNLREINYSFVGSTVHLYGALHKDPEGEFTPAHIELLLNDLRRLEPVRNLQVDVENWSITSSGLSWIIKNKREVHVKGRDRAKNMLINGSDKIRGALNEIQNEIPKETDPDKKGP